MECFVDEGKARVPIRRQKTNRRKEEKTEKKEKDEGGFSACSQQSGPAPLVQPPAPVGSSGSGGQAVVAVAATH